MSENVQELDRTQLTIQSYQERIAQLVVEYEAKMTELRVEFTLAVEANKRLVERVEELEGTDAVPSQDASGPTE
jgi:uncharacterized protein YxeA